jgi:hypothetical protein
VDYGHSRGGGYHHGYHNGHLGWWWVVAGSWYFLNRAAYESAQEPVYVEPQITVVSPPATPPVVYSAPPAPASGPSLSSPYWYYCRPTNSYYPYVSACTEGWTQVAATPAGP